MEDLFYSRNSNKPKDSKIDADIIALADEAMKNSITKQVEIEERPSNINFISNQIRLR